MIPFNEYQQWKRTENLALECFNKLYDIGINPESYVQWIYTENFDVNENQIAKYINNGTAIINTSIGISTINSPFKENITTMVKSKAIKVSGEMVGMNLLLYQSSPFNFTKINRLKIPITNGSPK